MAGGGQGCVLENLDVVSSARTRIERIFDPPEVSRLKDAAGQELSIGGPELASQAFAAGSADEVHLFAAPRDPRRRDARTSGALPYEP